MKIKKIDVYALKAQIEKPLRMPTMIIDKFFTTIVKITTDDGITGIGECIVRQSPKTTKSIIDDMLSPLILDRDPLDVEAIWWDMYKIMRIRGHHTGFYIEAISGIDTALWDILGKYHKLSIAKLLGGYNRKEVSVYASSIMLNDLPIMEKEAEKLVEAGYTAMKVKVGMGLHQDKKIVKAIRNVVGDTIDLMADANSCYDAGTAILLGQTLEENEYIWFEEPVPPDDINGYEQVRSKLHINIAAGESECTAFSIRNLLQRSCLDVVQPDVSRIGGITESRKVANLAQIFNKQYAPHTGFSSSVCVFASLQLAAYASNFSQYEYMYIDNPLQHILTEETPPVVNGKIAVPQGYGLGAELDEKKIKEYMI